MSSPLVNVGHEELGLGVAVRLTEHPFFEYAYGISSGMLFPFPSFTSSSRSFRSHPSVELVSDVPDVGVAAMELTAITFNSDALASSPPSL